MRYYQAATVFTKFIFCRPCSAWRAAARARGQSVQCAAGRAGKLQDYSIIKAAIKNLSGEFITFNKFGSAAARP